MIKMQQTPGHYGLITAFRNEAAWLDGVVRSVAGQTATPQKWVLVDDGSTDGSLAHARSLVKDLAFAEVFSLPQGKPRNFASQVYAQLAGVERLAGLQPAYIGFLDADILLPPDYYETLLIRFEHDAKLGLAGGKLVDRLGDRDLDPRAGSQEYHVPGGVQLFRADCYRQTGGYTAIPGGGQDVLIETRAMMQGWTVRAFTQPVAVHLRPYGPPPNAPFQRHYCWGKKFYTIGYHPLYFLASTIRRIPESPVFLSAACKLAGYLAAAVTRQPRAAPPAVMHFLRQQQMRRLRSRLTGWRRAESAGP